MPARSERLSNLTSSNDNGDINKQKIKKHGWEYLKTWVGIFWAGIFMAGGEIHQGGV